jgi:hypothetical protein
MWINALFYAMSVSLLVSAVRQNSGRRISGRLRGAAGGGWDTFAGLVLSRSTGMSMAVYLSLLVSPSGLELRSGGGSLVLGDPGG